MAKRLRDAQLGEYHRLDLNFGSVMVSDAEIRGLVLYLNNAQNREADRSVLELLEQMLELDNMDRPSWGETEEERQVAIMLTKGRKVPRHLMKKIMPEKYRQELAITEKTRDINERLRRYRFLPRAWSTGQKPWVVIWDVLSNTEKRATLRDGLVELNDGMALRMILDFARAGYLNRLRRCLHCRSWLYAKFRHQDFCRTKCQQKHYAESPEWKAKRRDYMR